MLHDCPVQMVGLLVIPYDPLRNGNHRCAIVAIAIAIVTTVVKRSAPAPPPHSHTPPDDAGPADADL